MSDFKTKSELIGNNEEMLLERGHPRRTPGHLFGIIYQKFSSLALAVQDSMLLLCPLLQGSRAGQETLSHQPQTISLLADHFPPLLHSNQPITHPPSCQKRSSVQVRRW